MEKQEKITKRKQDRRLILAPSLLAADFANLREELNKIENHCQYLHIDVMDGHFVPNLSFGEPIIKAIRKHTKLVFDCHLMVTNPSAYYETYAAAGANHISFHIETEPHAMRSIQKIRDLGMTVGVALNPSSPISLLEEILPELDLVLIMSVNPGFGGQKFISSSLNKVEKLAKIREKHNLAFSIQVDGGVNAEIGAELYRAGANNLVAGSYVFASDNPSERLEKMKKKCEEIDNA